MEQVTFEQVCGRPLGNDRTSYYFQEGMRHKRRCTNPDGMMMEIVLPEFSGFKTFMVANKMPPETPYVQLGMLLEGQDLENDKLDARYWGVGGSLRARLNGDEWSGKTIYLYHVIDKPSQRYPNWIQELVMYWR